MTLLEGLQLKRVGIAAVALLLVTAGAAEAQPYPLRLPAGTSSTPQRATSAPERVREEPRLPHSPLGMAYPVSFGYIPAVVMSDGTVWANFGYRYVPVRTACQQTRVIDGRGMQTPQRGERAPCYSRNSQGGITITR